MNQETQRPRYIVVFRDVSESNVSRISSIMNSRVLESSGGVAILSAKSEGFPKPKVYESLGLAASDFDEEELEKIKSLDSVEAVLPNYTRCIPPAPRLLPEEEVPSAIVSSDLAPGKIEAMNPALSYAMGMRDASNNFIRFMNGGYTAKETQKYGRFETMSQSHCWHLSMVGIGPRYNVATGKGVKVAVLDTGIDLNHKDFSGRFPNNTNTKSFVPDETVQDGEGHGTHCAGLVAGTVNSFGGKRYGAAPDAGLLVGKVLSNQGIGYDDWILDGILWAVQNGARVISMSFGSERGVGEDYKEEALAYEVAAKRLLKKGILLVAAVGNDSRRPYFIRPVGNPAACPSIMGIAAVDQNKKIAFFSNARMDDIGEVNLSAPGESIYSSYPNPKGFKLQSGTSMSTPIVAGVAALYLELQPKLTGLGLWKILERNAIPVGSQDDFGKGIVQAP